MYQIIYVNTYLLLADYLSISDDISHIKTKRRPLTSSNYKDIRTITEKIASLIFKKNVESVNIIVNAYLGKNNLFEPIHQKQLINCINYNHERNILLEISKINFTNQVAPILNKKKSSDVFYDVSETLRTVNNNEKPKTKEQNNNTDEIFYESIQTEVEHLKINKNSLIRDKLMNFFKRIFEYNLAITSFDLENLLEYNINNGIIYCDETKYIFDFYSKEGIYDLFMPDEKNEMKIQFVNY
jgi:hypothetical protein